MKHVTTMSRNCMTRALSITLILGLLLSSLAFSPNLSEIFSTNVWADTDGYWSDYTNTAWYDDHPDESTYKIGTAEELAGLAKLVNDEIDNFAGKTIQLTDDINLDGHDWVPIGVGSIEDENENIKDVFKGNFDGQGRTISNMHIGTSEAPANYKYAGLFGYVKADGGETITIANVNIGESSWVFSESLKSFFSAGGICAYAEAYAKDNAEANATITISNCSNSAKIYISDGVSPSAGGICASAKVSAEDNAEANATITISNCSNSAKIYISGGVSPSAGGICASAYAYANSSESGLKISNCSNSGSVTATSTNSDARAGGICAFAEAYASAKITISNCSNSGSVTATSTNSDARAGGICAAAYAAAYAYAKITISNCSNSAGISSYADNSSPYGRAYAGGICGVAKNLTISNCYYEEGAAATGIANEVDQAGEITALPESQMTAAEDTMDGEYWVDITIDGKSMDEDWAYITIDGNSKGKMALVDALNTWVKAYNATNPSVKALEWKVTTGNCPTLSIVDSVISTILPENQNISTNIDIAAQATEDETQVEETPASTGEWSEYANTAWYYNNPDESTYKIGTAEELAGLAKLVNDETDTFAGKTIKLTDNINLGDHYWVPIGVDDDTKSFKGSFDGDNKTISNMHIDTSKTAANYKYAGLFGYVEADSGETITIANVNIGENSWVYTYAGSFAVNAGGICAYAKVSAGTITISNCSNSAEIKAAGSVYTYAGGICAYAAAYSSESGLKISNCSNSGTITAKVDAGADTPAGGICAYADAYADATITISNCSNSAGISSYADNSFPYGKAYAGGICAYAYAYAYATITISNCSNSAEIKAAGGVSPSAGGICAKAEASAFFPKITISNCYYKEGTATRGMADKVDQAGQTTALPESQMTAAENTMNGQDWVDITINGDSKGKIALVDALGAI